MLSVEEINRLESENKMLRDSLSLANNIVNKYHTIIYEIKTLVENNGNYFTEDILDIIDKAEEEWAIDLT